LKVDVLEVVEFGESLGDFFARGIAEAYEHGSDLLVLFSADGLGFIELLKGDDSPREK
jgi:hypothetical protein